MPKLRRTNYVGGPLVRGNQALSALPLPTRVPGPCDKDVMVYAHSREQVIGPVWPVEHL